MNYILNLKALLILSFWSIAILSNCQTIEDFSLENSENELVDYQDIKGKTLTVIDFWATWCKPCVKAMPKLNNFYNKYQDQGLSVIGISCDGPRSIAKIDPLINSLKIDYHILKDINCEVMNSYQYQAFPTLLLIDENSEVVWAHEGFTRGDESKIEAAIIDHLK